MRRLSREAVVVAALGLSATVVTGGERMLGAPSDGPAAVAVQEVATVGAVPVGIEVRVGTLGVSAIVRGLDSYAVNTVSLESERGETVIAHLTTETGVRFDDVPIGSYRIVASSEGPIVHDADSAISSAVVVRSEPFALVTPGVVVVESR